MCLSGQHQRSHKISNGELLFYIHKALFISFNIYMLNQINNNFPHISLLSVSCFWMFARVSFFSLSCVETDMNRFLFSQAYSNLLRAHIDGLKKKDKKSKGKKTKAT